jgi:succinyl-diaminopimelate desuccinylase
LSTSAPAPMTDSSKILLESVASCREEMIAFTRELVAIPTENPPGNHYRVCAVAIARKLEQIGLEPAIVETPGSGYCVLAFHGEGERVLHLHGHYDVVPRSVEGQFEPAIKGGNMFGRGSSDMKSGLAAMIFAVKAIRQAGIQLKGRIGLVVVPDEETGGARGSAYLAQTGLLGKDSAGMVTAEPTSGVIWNANRGAISLRVTLKGKPAHVGLSYQGINAFEHMLVVAREVEKLRTEVTARETAYRIEPQAARRSILMMGGECRGGSNFNLVPESCSFTVDRRINPEEDLAAEKQRLLDLFSRLKADGIDHEIEIFQEAPASGVAEDHPFAQSLARAVQTVTGKTPAFEMCPGLLENRFYAQRGVPALAYGPGLLSISHGPHEFVPLANIGDCAAVYALLANDVLG